MEDTKTAMLFADQLMYHLSRAENLEYSSSMPGIAAIAETTTSRFQDDVWIAVRLLILAEEAEILNCSSDIFEHPDLVLDEVFAQLALQAVPLYFPDGYTHEAFLAYCAMVMGVGLKMVEDGRDDTILQFAAGAVSTVLIGFFLNRQFQEEGGWLGLFAVCTIFNRAFAKAKIEENNKQPNGAKKSRSGKCKQTSK